MKWIGCAAIALFLCAVGARAAVPSDDQIRRILTDRVRPGSDAGIVVGILGPKGRRIIAHGGGTRAFDGDTVFEIASVTKVFTALLLADMVQRGEVALDDPVAKLLPRDFRVPERGGRAITLVDLATHTSGLPFMADGEARPFLARHDLASDVGTTWEYSNLGYWLLAEAMQARTGLDYETLLRRRITGPLRMNSTAIAVSPKLRARLAPGHDASLQPAPAMTSVFLYATMAASGGIVSTANDLLTFLAASLGEVRSPLAPAMAMMLRTRRSRDANVDQALGWLAVGNGDGAFFTHDGGSLGYASSVAWDPVRRIGVVVLTNQVDDVADIARHILRPELPLAKRTPPAAKRVEIAVASDVLDRYAGRYEVEDGGVFVIARDGHQLTIESPPDWGLPKLRLRAEGEREFFVAELPLRVVFQVDAERSATGMLIHPPRGQKVVPATRLR